MRTLPLAALMALASCREVPATQLLVVVDTNVERNELGFVRVTLESPEGRLQEERIFDLPPRGQVALPFSFGVVPSNGDASRRLRITADLRGPNGASIVRRSALCGFFPDTILRLPLYLPNLCRGLDCPQGTTCRGDERTCVPDEIDLRQLERVSPAIVNQSLDGSLSLPFADAGAPADDVTVLSDLGSPADAGGVVDTGLVPDAGAFMACARPAPLVPAGMVAAPRLVGPLSGSVALSARPLFRWANLGTATGARIEVCADPACTELVAAFEGTGTSLEAPCVLPRGTHFFRARGMVNGNFGTETSPVWQVRVAANTGSTRTLDGIERDFNGDGLADVAWAAGNSVFLVRGVRGGVPTELSAPIFTASTTVAYVELVGDLNGDGVGDLAVSSGDGLKVVFGAREAATRPAPWTIPAPAGITGFASGNTRVLAAAGDVDGDGYGDLIVGSPSTRNNVGAAHLVFGGPTAPTLVAAGVGAGQRALELYGFNVVGAADREGDGRSDVVVGAPGEAVNAGIAYQLTISARTLTGRTPWPGRLGNGRLGQYPIAFTDLTGDGRAEMATRINGSSSLQVNTGGASSERAIGAGIFAAVLHEGDSRPGSDLVCVRENPVSVYVVSGGPNFDLSRVDRPIAPEAGLTFSTVIASTGDMDGDNLADFMIGTMSNALVFVRGVDGNPTPVRVNLGQMPSRLSPGT